MRLRPGLPAKNAIEQLDAALVALENARSVPFRSAEPLLDAGPRGFPGRANYLSVVDNLERQLRNLFVETSFVDCLHGERYWRIHELGLGSPVPEMVIQAEINRVEHQVKSWRDTLASFSALAGRPGDAVVVLDTNAFMHYRLFTELPWHQLLGQGKTAIIRLVVPLPVLDELDDKGYSGNKRLAKRAGKVLGVMSQFFDAIDEHGVATLDSDHTTLEILGEDDGHQRRTNSDSEILDRAQFLAQVINHEVTVVTADRGMRVRGRARGINVLTLPEKYRLPLDDDETSAKQG